MTDSTTCEACGATYPADQEDAHLQRHHRAYGGARPNPLHRPRPPKAERRRRLLKGEEHR